jgi:hypothetical protein
MFKWWCQRSDIEKSASRFQKWLLGNIEYYDKFILLLLEREPDQRPQKRNRAEERSRDTGDARDPLQAPRKSRFNIAPEGKTCGVNDTSKHRKHRPKIAVHS